jgi:hypothetical protein
MSPLISDKKEFCISIKVHIKIMSDREPKYQRLSILSGRAAVRPHTKDDDWFLALAAPGNFGGRRPLRRRRRPLLPWLSVVTRR